MSSIETLEKNHPVRVYLEENILIKELLHKINSIDINKDYETFFNVFNNLCEVEKHYLRKENQLFPFIENYGWNTTSQYMWTFHDQIRENLKEIRLKVEEKDFEELSYMIDDLSENMEHMILLEETTIFPNALESLDSDDWDEIKQGDDEVGTMLADEEAYVHPSQDKKKRKLPFPLDDRTHYDEGYLTLEQVNFIFKFLPIDITYVDENDRVVFYNKGDNRVFPRSAGIIGREVKFCHPPKSVDQVLKILEEFKAGRQDTAEFWIQFKGQFIHIRYFAIRDEEKNYKGVMEVTQEISEIKALEGERRILDWHS